MKTEHGRIGEYNEFLQITLKTKKIVVVLQKSGENGWYLYLVHPGKKGSTITVDHFDAIENGQFALNIAAKVLEKL